MSLGGPVTQATLLGAAHGVVEWAALFAVSERYTLPSDWFLAVIVVFANASGFAIAARYGVSLIGVALAGLAGMMAGGWVGSRTIGDFEFRVPTPPEERVLRIRVGDKERVIERPDVPAETVRRIPVGGGVGVLAGWALGAGAYAWMTRRREEFADPDEGEPDV